MSEVLVQFVDIQGRVFQTLGLNQKGRGVDELIIHDGHGRVVNLKHLEPHLSLMLVGHDKIMIGDEKVVEPGSVSRFDLDEFTLRIVHDPVETVSLKIR